MKKSLYILMIGAGALMASCAKEVAVDEPSGRSIRFQVSAQPMLPAGENTKGVPYADTDDVTSIPFGVSAYAYAASSDVPALYMNTAKVVYDAGKGKWVSSQTTQWPDQGGKVRFFAYAPYSAAQMETRTRALPTLSFSAPAKIEEHKGLLVSTPQAIDDYPAEGESGTVDLTFHHILSGINFTMKGFLNIESVTLEGAYDSGVYSFATDSWSEKKVANTYTITAPETVSEGDYNNFDIRYTLMLLPQTCPAGAVLRMVADGKTYEIPLQGHEWKAGYAYDYVLYRDDYVFGFSVPDVEGVSPDGGVITVDNLESWRTKDGGVTKESIPWKVQGLYATSQDALATTNPLSSCFVTSVDAGSLDEQGRGSLKITCAPAESHLETTSRFEDIQKTLRAAGVKGTASSPWNLSNSAGASFIEESANTYIVSAPGYYRIPLVMGNGIKNGTIVAETYSEANYRDYMDAPISSPYLQSSSTGAGVPTTAFVIWEDQKQVDVKSDGTWEVAPVSGSSAISFDGNIYWLNFHIDAENITQGLIHLGVNDERGLVMWSYLIWVTEAEPRPLSNPTFMTKNLGWIEQGTAYHTVYDAEEVYIRLQQDKLGGKFYIMKVSRPGSEAKTEVDSEGYSPYYQFGRKDPLIPLTTTGSVSTYGLYTSLPQTVEKSSVGTAIRTPWAHLSYGTEAPFDWCSDTGKTNWWVVTSGGKSIYDPSPAGFRVPASETLALLPAKVGEFKNGWWMGPNFYAALGYRNSSKGDPVNVGNTGYYWSNKTVNDSEARILEFDSSSIDSSSKGRRVRALSVRPASM